MNSLKKIKKRNGKKQRSRNKNERLLRNCFDQAASCRLIEVDREFGDDREVFLSVF